MDSDEPSATHLAKVCTIYIVRVIGLIKYGPCRDPKTVTEEEYIGFYQSTFKDYEKPLAWHHFSGDSGSGVSYKAILYIPSRL